MDIGLNLRQRRGWLIMLLGTAGGGGIVASVLLYNNPPCLKVQLVANVGVALVSLLVAAVCAIVLARDNNLVSVAGSVILLGLMTLIGPAFVAPVLRSIPQLSESWCEQCERASQVAELRKDKLYDAARSTAERCLSETNDAACEASCGCELARVRFEEADQLLEGAPTTCAEAKAALDGAIRADQSYGCGLGDAIIQLERRLDLICAPLSPSPSPPPSAAPPVVSLDILRSDFTHGVLTIDVRVLHEGLPVPGLASDSFALDIDGSSISDIDVQETEADDPSCVIAVVDNSGSIDDVDPDGPEKVRLAIDTINKRAQTADELGLVLFADRVAVIQPPTLITPLNRNVVDAGGRETALWDGVKEGIALASQCSSDNRYLIVITDGQDNASQYLAGRPDDERASALIRQANNAGVRVCTIGVGLPPSGADPLGILAIGAGCDHFPACEFDEVATLVDGIMGDIRAFYRIQVSGLSLTSNTHSTTVYVEGAEVTFEFQP